MRNGRNEEVPIFRLDPLLIGSIFPIHGEDRVVVTPEEVSQLLPSALKVVEDRKFDTHWGVNPTAILRAAFVNLRAGAIEQGGSTLTQQLVKSYFLDNRRTIGRKIEEAIMSMLLEVHFSKQDLMNAYINEIYLGQDGTPRDSRSSVSPVSSTLASRSAELQLHEVALLVAIVRGPSYYDPRRHPERARERRDLVLKLMADHGVIAPDMAKKAAKRPLGIVSSGSQAGGGYYPAFLDLVRRTLRRDYREEDLTEAGLRIFSTLDPTVQTQAEKALTQELDRLDKTRKTKSKVAARKAWSWSRPAEWRSRRDGRRPASKLRWFQSGAGCEALDRLAGQAGDLSGRDRKRTVQRRVHHRRRSGVREAREWHAVGAERISPKQFYGPVPLVRALAQSMNLATVRSRHVGGPAESNA